MANYDNTKSGPGGQYPVSVAQASWPKLEALLTPEQLKTRYLFGIPLYSNMKDPRTNKVMEMTDDMLKDEIESAVSDVEAELGIDIFPNSVNETHPFDRFDYEQFGYFRLRRRPCASVESVTVNPVGAGNPTSQDVVQNGDVYTVPLEWISTGYLPYGQINIVPLVAAVGQGGIVPSQVAGGAAFLQIMGSRPWVPSFWRISYTSGFPDGKLPRVVNEIIGTVAAMRILSKLAATYAKSTSHSLGIDSLSQSISTPGPQLFQQRMTELADQRKMLKGKLKAMFGLKLFSSQV